MFKKKQDNTHTLTKYKSVFKQMQSPNTKWSNSGPVVFCRVMQSDGQRAAPLRSVTCWHLCILCHLLYMHISYIVSHHCILYILYYIDPLPVGISAYYAIYFICIYHIIYITSYHPWYITPSLLCTIFMHITQFNTIYILSTITQITRSRRMSLYVDMCCTFSGGWIDLFVCFCVFVEMHMFLYVYKIAHSLVV